MDGIGRRDALALVPAVLLTGRAVRVGLQSQNNILAGNSLARAQIQSPNYVPGVSGWAIFQNGNAEFNSGTFRGHIVGGDLFIYNGAPGLGNPPIFWATSAAADPFGNPITSTSGLQGTGTFEVGNLKLAATGITAISNPLNVNGLRIGLSSPGSLVEVNASTQLLIDGATLFDQPIGTVKPGTTDTLETWHAMTLINGWANVATFATARYQLINGGRDVEVIAAINAAAATASTFFTVPAGYVPASQQPVGAAGVNASVPAGLSPWCRVDTSGNLTVQNTGAVGAAWQFFVHGTYSMTA